MPEKSAPLLIKRYASRRLYNTETSDYVTLEDIARFIREGREVKIVDLKSGDDLTRQYLLQIIAEHESRGENVLPVDVLTDLVRAYTTQAASVMPEFLKMSLEMLREGQSRFVENMASMNPMARVPGFEAMRAQQEAFLKAMTGGMAAWGEARERAGGGQAVPGSAGEGNSAATREGAGAEGEDLDAIKQQLAELQSRLDRLAK